MLPAADNNPRGFWESRELAALHDELLAAAGSSWDDWTRLPLEWLDTAIAGRFRARLLALLEANFAGSRLFVIKDPRMCRLVPLWRTLLREFGATVRVVIPLRNPVEVAASLASRDGLSTGWSLLIWLRHVLDAERETRDLPRAVVGFGDLLHDHRGVLAAMRRRLAIKWPRPAADARAEIDEFLSLAERHHSVDDRSLDLRPDVPMQVRRAYEALWTIARDSQNAGAYAELDQIGSDLDAAAAIFGPIVAAQARTDRTESAEIDELRRSVERCVVEAGALQQELTTVRSTLSERSTDADRVAGDLAAARAELADVRADLAQRIAEAQRLTGELSALRAVLGDRSSEVGRLHEVLGQSERRRPVNPAGRSRRCRGSSRIARLISHGSCRGSTT
jgi:hypothetical protein